MDIEFIHNTLSEKRFARYMQRCNGDFENALKYYEFNSQMAQSCHIVLERFEVLLRNKIHHVFTKVYKSEEWYDQWLLDKDYSQFYRQIVDTKIKLTRRKEQVDPGKMIAEFTLGFWVTLFNQGNEKLLWKPLRNVFSEMPKESRQRKIISSNLNKIRKHRNRISHQEPIAWDINAMNENYRNIIQIMQWINLEYSNWSEGSSDFTEQLTKLSESLKERGISKMELK